MKKIFLVSILILVQNIMFCQVSGHPVSVKWNHIVSPYWNIIYPKGRYDEAARIGNIINLMNENPKYNNLHKNRKIDLILQTHQVIANGYVGIGPYRSEFYTTPLQNSFLSTNTDWLDVLAVHEYKHVHQLNDTRVGMTRLASYLLGQGGWTGLKFFAMPNWYAEGDAISSETFLTSGGRGRSPQFTARQKALLLEGKKFRYGQMRGGSFRYELPNHYVFGHILHEYVRKNHSAKTWYNVINRAAKYKKGPFYNFSLSLKNETGLRARGLYKKAYQDFYETTFQNKLLDIHTKSEVGGLTKPRKTPTYYEFPFINQNLTYVLKNSFKDLPHIALILPNGIEKKITGVGINTEEYLGYKDSIFTWCEYNRDPRWAFQNYSDIYIYNMKTGRKRKITRKGKFFSPDPNPGLSQIVAVSMDTSLISKIIFLDMESGKLISEVPPEKDGFISYPKWVSDTEVVYVLRKENKAALYFYNTEKKERTQLTTPTTHLLNHPFIHQRDVFFTATFDDSDQIFSANIDTKQVTKHSNDPVGAYTPVYDGKSLIYHTLIGKGTKLKKLTTLNPEPYTITERADIPGDVNITKEKTEVKSYEEKPYKRLGRLQLHSYAPSQNINRPGVQLYFENALANIEGIAEVYYNVNEKALQTTSSIGISAGYPVFTLGISPVSRASFAWVPDSNKILRYTFNEFNYGGSVSVPLRWVHGNMIRSLRPSAGINYKYIYNQQEIITPKDLTSFTNFSVGFSISNLKRIAIQNFGTKWGQEISFNYRSSMYGPKGNALQLRANVYLPGLLKNHRIKLGGEYYREEFLNSYKFSNNFQYARGGSALPYNAARRFTAEYGLPLFYPEIGVLDITYIKRVRLNIFTDITAMKLPRSTLYAHSLGGEILFDNVWLNTFPLTMGVRFSYLNEVDGVKFKPEFLFAVDL